MSIGVSPESEGKGIGSLILESFCREMATRGVTISAELRLLPTARIPTVAATRGAGEESRKAAE